MAAIPKIRSALYRTARILGDLSAIGKGRVGRRIMRRGAGRVTSRWLGRLFK
jgi:hypothetical protein